MFSLQKVVSIRNFWFARSLGTVHTRAHDFCFCDGNFIYYCLLLTNRLFFVSKCKIEIKNCVDTANRIWSDNKYVRRSAAFFGETITICCVSTSLSFIFHLCVCDGIWHIRSHSANGFLKSMSHRPILIEQQTKSNNTWAISHMASRIFSFLFPLWPMNKYSVVPYDAIDKRLLVYITICRENSFMNCISSM